MAMFLTLTGFDECRELSFFARAYSLEVWGEIFKTNDNFWVKVVFLTIDNKCCSFLDFAKKRYSDLILNFSMSF